MPVSVESGRKPYLDGLRGVAALVVFFGHLSLALQVRGGTLIFNGPAAVCIFFVLSGYVLSELALHSGLSFPAQMLRRYLRLIVPMLITSTFAWALLSLGAYRNQEAAALVNSWWLGSWYKFEPSFAAMFREAVYDVFISGRSDYNCNLWTMQPELIGSLYVFLISAIAPARRLRAICYIALGCFHWSDYVLLFSVGALLHDFHPELARPAPVWPKAVVFVFGVFLCVTPQKWLGVLQFPVLDEMYWHMLAASLVVWSVLHWPLLQEFLGSGLGRLLGRISFVLYLIHVPIICSLTAWLVVALPSSIAVVTAAATTIFTVFAVSITTYRYIDQLPTGWSRSAGYLFDSLLGDRSVHQTA